MNLGRRFASIEAVGSPCRPSRLCFSATGISGGWRTPSTCCWSSQILATRRYTCGEAPDYDRSQWLDVKFKLDLDFPNLPYLMDGNNKITQSNAILRYIACKHNMCGDTAEEKIRVDIMENQIMDFRMQLVRLHYNSDHEKMKPQYLEQLPGQLKQFSLFLGKYSWFAGEKLTFVDFLTYDVLDQNRMFEPKCLDEFPNLKAFMCRFEALEKIAAYMQSDRFFKMPINNKMAKWGNRSLC